MAVALVNTNTMDIYTASISVSQTITAGSNLAIADLIFVGTSLSVSAITYGGQAMTSCGAAAHDATNNFYAQSFYLVNPPTGANTFAATITGASRVYASLSGYSGAHTTTPVRAGTYQSTSGAADGSGHFSLVITSDAADRSHTLVNSEAAALTGTNQTQDGSYNDGSSGNSGYDHCTTAAASVTHTWTTTAAAAFVAIGFSINAAPGGPLTLYVSNPIQSGSKAGLLALVAPTASTSTTGWTVGTTGVQRYSRQTYNVEVPTTGFTATVQPSGAPVNTGEDCWRISAATTGDFSAGTWYSSLSVIAVTNASSQRGAALFRVWRSVNFDGTAATEITKSRMTGSTLASNLLTTVAQSSSASTQVAAFSLANEYLFLQVAWSSTTTATNANADVLIRMGNMGTTGSGSGLVTSTFSSTNPGGASAVNGAHYYMMMADWFNK